MFRVEVVGTGFSAEVDGTQKKVGFLCVRVVRASVEAEAREVALDEVHSLGGFKALLTTQQAGTSHHLSIEEIIDLGESRPGDVDSTGTGLILFDERS